jgi:imidazolonepropionase-like amidohydrolase
MVARTIGALAYGLGGLLALHFVFLWLLAERASIAAVAVALIGLALVLPPLRGVLAGRAVIGSARLRGAACIALLVLATVWLERADRYEIERGQTAFKGMTILTGLADHSPIEDGVVLVDASGRIAAVGTRANTPIPAGYRVIELRGKTLLPGLINAHGHLILPGRDRTDGAASTPGIAPPPWLADLILGLLETYPGRRLALWQMANNASRALRAGVTTLRGLGDPNFYDVELREQVVRGKRRGPRLLVAGPLLCVTGGHAHQIGHVFDGPDEGRRAVRNSLFHGVDTIKIASTGGVSDAKRIGEAGELQMTPEEIAAVVDEAHRKRVLVSAHAESREGVLEALRAGVDIIEHGAELDAEAIALFADNPESLRGYSTLHPTLSVLVSVGEPADALRDDPRRYVIAVNGARIKKAMITGYRQAVAAGVHIGVGTDAGIVDHASVWKEWVQMVEIGGLSNAEVIHTGTLATAQSIGIAEITGSIEVGKFADLLVVDGNPLTDLSTLSKPYLVVAAGALVPLD